MPRAQRPSVAATAQLEGWRLPVAAALQPLLVVDRELRLVAASAAAQRLVQAEAGSRLVDAPGLRDLAPTWESTPFAQAVVTGESQRSRLELASTGGAVDAVVSPLFGVEGVIGALVFLTAT